MKKTALAFAVVAAAALLPAVAQAGSVSAADARFACLKTIYAASGVVDNGGPPDQGIATSVHCSNASTVAAQVRWIFYSATGTRLADTTQPLAGLRTLTVSTHDVLYLVDAVVATGA